MEERRREAWIQLKTGWAAGLVVLLVPVCATLARGGADWHLGERARVSWFDEPTAWAMLALVLGVAVVEPRRAERAGVALLAALAAFSVATAILWSGGGRLGPVSLGHPEASFVFGCAALAVAGLRGIRRAPDLVRVTRWLILAAVAGWVATAVLVRIDASRIRAAIPVATVPAQGVTVPTSPDLLWIVVDTLRADALGVYAEGEERRTPFLDDLGRRGIVFERAYATAPWTLPSMMSLLTSRLPSSLDPVGRGRSGEIDRLPRLAPGQPTWVEAFRRAGYHTAGFQKNPFLGDGSGFEASFDLYRSVGGDHAEMDSAAQLVDATLRWADALVEHRREEGAQPFLLYVHFMDPHVDYRAPRSWWSSEARGYSGEIDGRARGLHARIESDTPIEGEDRAQLERLYEAEVAYLDSQVARLVAGLEARGLVDDETLLVFGSDHGEQFGEHGGWEHGDLHRENVQVPAILAGAGLPRGRITRPVSTLDVGPTLLELAGLPALEGAEGKSLASLLRGERGAGEARETAQVASVGSPVWTEYGERLRLTLDPWVLLLDGRGRAQLFDGRGDHEETRDLASSEPERLEALRAIARVHAERSAGAGEGKGELRVREIDPRLLEALRELGYDRSP